MKYMHFNSSCPYAGLANMLALQGYDTEDYQIALDMKLPLLLHRDDTDGTYQAGASLQSSRWFDLYLNPRGFRCVEAEYDKQAALSQFMPGTMCGIQVTPQSRHAVIFLSASNGVYHFLNNKWEKTNEPEQLTLSAEEVLARLPRSVMLAHLEPCEPLTVDLTPYLQTSLSAWHRLRNELEQFISVEQSPQSLREAMNPLFRPLLLDGLSMMQLLGESAQVERLQKMQTQFLSVLRQDRPAVLLSILDHSELDKAFEHFMNLIVIELQMA